MFMNYLIHQLMKFFKLFFYFFFIYRLSMVFLCFINAFLNLKIPIEISPVLRDLITAISCY